MLDDVVDGGEAQSAHDVMTLRGGVDVKVLATAEGEEWRGL